jgi:hypothetical protein
MSSWGVGASDPKLEVFRHHFLRPRFRLGLETHSEKAIWCRDVHWSKGRVFLRVDVWLLCGFDPIAIGSKVGYYHLASPHGAAEIWEPEKVVTLPFGVWANRSPMGRCRGASNTSAPPTTGGGGLQMIMNWSLANNYGMEFPPWLKAIWKATVFSAPELARKTSDNFDLALHTIKRN